VDALEQDLIATPQRLDGSVQNPQKNSGENVEIMGKSSRHMEVL
jgi:hypothetical protein